MAKLQIAIYWGAACGGCDVAVLDTNEFILTVDQLCDVRLWPIAADGKYKDVEAMEDGELDLTLFNGAVRNSENEHVAKMLRQKSKVLVALGSCSHLGGIPGLANQFSKVEIYDRAYLHNPSLQDGNDTVPQTEVNVNGNKLTIPQFYERVYALDQVVDVDYYLPGCPPAPEQIKAVLEVVAGGNLPPKGSVVGASDKAVCDDCKRKKTEVKITKINRPWEILQDPEVCLLEQGILCAGSATRSGCGVRCPDSGMPCRGCYGPLPSVVDQGAKFISAVASVIDSNDPKEVEKILDSIPDFTGYSYRFAMPASILERSIK